MVNPVHPAGTIVFEYHNYICRDEIMKKLEVIGKDQSKSEITANTAMSIDEKNDFGRVFDDTTSLMKNISPANTVVVNEVYNTSYESNKIDTQRNQSKTIQGTALDDSNGKAFAADIDIVVYSVARNVTAIQVSQWIEDHGIKVSDCVLLTKYEQARTLSFKVTIRANEYEKSQDPSMWPYGVKVRRYRTNNRRNHIMKQTEDVRRNRLTMEDHRNNQNMGNIARNNDMNRYRKPTNFELRQSYQKTEHDRLKSKRRDIQPINNETVLNRRGNNKTVHFADDFDIWLLRRPSE